MIRNLIFLLAITALLMQQSCASTSKSLITNTDRDKLARIAIISPPHEPITDIEGLAHNKIEGVAIGAGDSFYSHSAPAASLFAGGCSGTDEGAAFCGAAAVIWLSIFSVSSMLGGFSGAMKAPSGEEMKKAELSLAKAVHSAGIQDSLQKQIVKRAQANGRNITIVPDTEFGAIGTDEYQQLADKDIQTVLEVTLTKLNVIGTDIEIDSPLQLQMEAQVRILDIVNDQEMFSQKYLHRGKSLHLSEWLADPEVHLLPAVKNGYQSLAAKIYENVFMLYPLSSKKTLFSGISSYGLAPSHPKLSLVATVKERQPELSWQSFPQPEDLEALSEDLSKIRNVKYDLVIARGKYNVPYEVVYRREGLENNRHKLELMLMPGTKYFWSVRARFELDGEQRVTDWGVTDTRSLAMTTPSQCSYMFTTAHN